MSRHFFDCELRLMVRVRLGYDRPLNQFFLQVERLAGHADSDDSPFLYASIDDPDDSGTSLDYYRGKLEQLGLRVPDSMFDAVAQDAARNAGNRCVQHLPDGRMIEPVPN